MKFILNFEKEFQFLGKWMYSTYLEVTQGIILQHFMDFLHTTYKNNLGHHNCVSKDILQSKHIIHWSKASLSRSLNASERFHWTDQKWATYLWAIKYRINLQLRTSTFPDQCPFSTPCLVGYLLSPWIWITP